MSFDDHLEQEHDLSGAQLWLEMTKPEPRSRGLFARVREGIHKIHGRYVVWRVEIEMRKAEKLLPYSQRKTLH